MLRYPMLIYVYLTNDPSKLVGVNEDFVRAKLEQIANEMMVEIYSYED